MSNSWIRRAFHALVGSKKKRARVRRRTQCLVFEGLEDRRLMATRVWDGGATINDRWTNKNNWLGNVAPIAGDDLVFPADIGALDRGTNNDFPTDTLFRSIRIEGSDYTLSGNRIKLSGDLINAPKEEPEDGDQTEVRLDIRLTAGSHLILSDTAEADINSWSISGQISDDGSTGDLTYRFSGPDLLVFNLSGKQANTYDQPIRVESLDETPTFFLDKDDDVAAFSGPLTISNVSMIVEEAGFGALRRVGQLKPRLPVTLLAEGSLGVASEQLGPLTMSSGELTQFSAEARGDAPVTLLTGTITVTGSNINNINGFSNSSMRLTTLVGGSRVINVASGAALAISVSLDDGILRKTGSGTLVLSPAGIPNRHDATHVLEGLLKIGFAGAEKIAVPNRLEIGGGPDNSTAAVEVGTFSANAIANDAAVVVRERGELRLSSNLAEVFRSLDIVRGSVVVGTSLEISEDITMTGGTIDGNAGAKTLLRGNLKTLASNVAANIEGTLALSTGNHVVTVANGSAQNDLLITATISNEFANFDEAASLTKVGPGRLLLSSANTYTGTTTVAEGVLAVNGNNDPTQGEYIVDGGFLTGFGEVSEVQVKRGAVNAGNGPGRFDVLGTTTFDPFGKFVVNMDAATPGSGFDVLVTESLELKSVNPVGDPIRPDLNPLLTFTPDLGTPFRVLQVGGATPLPADQFFETVGGLDLTEGKTFKIDGQDFTITYLGGDGNDVVLTRNTGPAFANRTITPEIVEGGRVLITGQITEPNPNDTFFLDVDWGDGTTNTYRFLPGTPRDVKVGHRYLDDPAGGNDRYQVKLLWRDQFRGSNSAVLTTIVRNDAPTLGEITASLPPLVVGQPITIQGTIRDSGPLDSFKIHVRWNASGPWQAITLPAGSKSFSLKHTYATPGQHQVSILLIDDDLDFDQTEFVLSVTSA